MSKFGASGGPTKKLQSSKFKFDKNFQNIRQNKKRSPQPVIMAGRQSHGHAPSKKPKTRTNANKSNKRALDAFSIASHDNPDKVRIKQHRLGAQEGGIRPGKRHRDEEDDEGDEEEGTDKKKPRKGPIKGRFDELDLDEGSDSEGHEWKLGQVDSDDDSDLDSDEAFGESDEERFEGFAFSGSSDKKIKKNTRTKDVNLDEDEEEDSGSELEEGDLGDDAVDLATMLDMAEEEENEARNPKQKQRKDIESDSEDDEDVNSEETGDESSASSADEDEDDEAQDPVKLAAIQNMIASLPQVDASGRPAKQRNDGASEYNAASISNIASSKNLTLDDFTFSTTSNPSIKSSRRLLGSDGGSQKKSLGKLEMPLAKRQQDRLDRSAAYDKSKETLDRWTDTVKHNRRAEHLVFPLPDNDVLSAKNNKNLVPTNLSKPFNELEATIQSILEESGLATANGKDDEDRLRDFEELEANKLSIEDVKARRDQLRMARELLFREEAKSKRIKKIKSKSYRKVHRKQREKEERLNQEALAEGGFIPSEDEIEAQDRRRAEERMGSRHRGSKWAKAMKGTGRAAWDEDARSGVTEMARRDEELRKRVEGRAVRKEFDDGSDGSFDDSDDDISGDGEEAQTKRLLRKLDRVGEAPLVDPSLPGARLANMDFMRKADAVRKKRNDDTVEEMRRELAGEESDGHKEVEIVDVGRRAFGPGNNAVQDKTNPFKLKNEFEESAASDEDDGNEVQLHGLENSSKIATKLPQSAPVKGSNAPLQVVSRPHPASSEGGAWSKATSKSSNVNEAEAKRRRHKKNNAIDIGELDLLKAAVIATQPKTRKSDKKTATLDVGSGDDESNDEIHLPFAIRDQELIKRAFAGADVVGEFEAEKKQIAEDEDEKVIDNTLPGWGAWVGDGVSKKEKARNKGRFLTKSEGIKAKNRKDAKLDKVIINEKRVKKVFELQLSVRAELMYHRMENILHRLCLTLSRARCNTRDLFEYPSAPNGQRKRPSKMPRSRGSYSSKALLHLCRSLYYKFETRSISAPTTIKSRPSSSGRFRCIF